MKKNILSLICLIAVNSYCQESDTAILEKMISQLNNIEKVRYQSTFQSTEMGKIYGERRNTVFFDFKNSPKTAPKFLMYGDSGFDELIFNGKQSLYTLNKKKITIVDNSPNINNSLMLTLYPLKKLLPHVLTEENIIITRKKDTLINKKEHFVFDLSYKNGFLDWDNLVLKNGMSFNSQYSLVINKTDFLPQRMTMNNGPTGTLSKTYDNFDFDYTPDNQIWTGSLIPSEYQIMTAIEYHKILQKKYSSKGKSKNSFMNKNIGEWKIPNLENNDLVDFSKLKGNVVLLEFWFKYCGPCVKAVPELNLIQEKYKDEKFQLFGIEFREDFTKEDLRKYVSKIDMNYPSLYKGEDIASNFGITSAPTFMIIDKKGKIVYIKSGFNKEEILNIIDTHINKNIWQLSTKKLKPL